MNFKTGKWAKKIIELQHNDGSWGYFHTLSTPTPKQPITTEQALRRLEILGFSIEDKPIQKALNYLNNCLIGKSKIPDREEKTHNWSIFFDLMLSTWIKIFTKDNKMANSTAEKWREIINNSFDNGFYDHNMYIKSFEKRFDSRINPKAARHIDFVHFYPVSILANILDKKTESVYFNYILNHEKGIYYIYDKKLLNTPKLFQSKNTSRYLRAIELLSKYKNPECKKLLQFVVNWLNDNRNAENKWDMGKDAKDGINFPLSDSWRAEEDRINDCTYRINKLLERINNNKGEF